MFSWYYTGRFPWRFNYYVVHGILITVTTLCAEFVLMRIEQQEIKLSFDVDGMTNMVEQGKAVISEVQDKVKRIQANLEKSSKGRKKLGHGTGTMPITSDNVKDFKA